MGFIQTIKNYISPPRTGLEYNSEPEYTTKSWEELKSNTVLMTSNGSPGTLAPTVSVTQALNKYRTWVYPCVDIIKRHMSMIDFYLYREIGQPNDEEFERILDHPVVRLLKKPNKYMSGRMFRETIMMHLDLTGMAFARILRNGVGQPAELHIIPPHELVNIEVGTNTDEIIKKFSFAPLYERHKRLDLFWQDVLYFWYPHPTNPYLPFSPMQSLAHVTDMELYMQVYQKDFFQNNARPDFVILLDKGGNQGTVERIREGWAAKHRGPGKQHIPAILGPNVQIQPIGLPAKDFEFAALAEFSRDHILGTYRVPKAMLGLMESYNRASVITAETVFAKEALEPRLSLFTDVINMQLLPQFRSTDGLEFKFESPLPKDDEWELTKNQGELTMGLTTLNEIRKRKGQKPYKSKMASVPWVNGMPLQGEDEEVDKMQQAQMMGGAAGAMGGMPVDPNAAAMTSDPTMQGAMGVLGGRPEGTTLSAMLQESLRASKPSLSMLLNAARGKRGGLSSLVSTHPEMSSFGALLQSDRYKQGMNALLSKGIYDYIESTLDPEDRIIFKIHEKHLGDIEILEDFYKEDASEFFIKKGVEFGQIVQKMFSDFVTKGEEGYFDIDEETLRNDYKDSARDYVTKAVREGMTIGYEMVTKTADMNDRDVFEKESKDAAGIFLDKSADLKVESTKKALTKIIREGIKDGLDSEVVSGMIVEKFKDMGIRRAEMIARTEIAAAVDYGIDASFESINREAGKIVIKKARFWAALDDRTCKECEEKHKDVMKNYETGEVFIESATVHPYCRCARVPDYN